MIVDEILEREELLGRNADSILTTGDAADMARTILALRRALNEIDALDPEEHIYGCSHDAVRGIVIRMGQAARHALEGGR